MARIGSSVDPQGIANLIISTLEGALMISRLEGNRPRASGCPGLA